MRYDEQINIKLYKYENSSFVLQAIIDDYQEISFAHNLYEAGDFTITINFNIPNALKFERGMWIQFGNDSYMFGEILTITDSIGADGKGSQIRTITGKDARFIFKRRIIKNLNNEENWAMTAKGEIVLRELVKAQCGSGAETKRQLPIANTIPSSSSAIGKEYSVAESFSNLYDTLVTIATQSEIGWRVKFDGALTLEVYAGTDLSNQVQFSTDFDSLSNGQFTDSSEAYANTIYVGGKGTGSDRDIYEGEIETEGETPEGLERYEAWDNQSEMTSESEYEAEALSMLTQYGQTLNISGNGLAKCPYIFKEQYNIGDVITLAFSGKSAKAQILSVTEHWAWGQYGISFSFGKPQNDLSRQLQLILKQIQKASNKTSTTSSVKYYTIPTDTEQPKADVIYDTIGFQGTCASGGSTFKLYYDSEKTGAKTYHVWFKQLGGGKLTLTTGVSGKANLVLNSGTYVAIMYVDAEGNVLSQGATATSTIESGNTQPVESGAVAEEISNLTEIASSLPTDAVLHYSFDEVPDYPDGNADIRLLNNNTYDLQSGNFKFLNNGGATFTNNNGNLNINVSSGNNRGAFISKTYLTNKIIKLKINVTELTGFISVVDNSVILQEIHKTGIYDLTSYHTGTAQYTDFYLLISNGTFTAEILEIYIGNGSYNTPIIDNANGQNNAVNNGGIAVQGVSGKGAYFLNGKYADCGVFDFTDDFTISLWINPENQKNGTGTIISKTNSIIIYNGANWEGGYERLHTYIYTTESANHKYFGDLLPINKWTHFVLQKEGTTERVYVNGVLYYQTTLTDSVLRKSTNPLLVNGTIDNKNQSYDDLLIFNRALSETEVQALYQNKANTPKYFPTPTNEIKEGSLELATSKAVADVKYTNISSKSLSESGWYKIASFSNRNIGSSATIDLVTQYNYTSSISHKIQINYGWLNANILDFAQDPQTIFDKIRICYNSNNNDYMGIYVHYSLNRENNVFLNINACSNRFTPINFETDSLTWENTIEYNLGIKGLYIDGENRIPDPPTTNGTYTLQCTVSSGSKSYAWVSSGNRSIPTEEPKEDSR